MRQETHDTPSHKLSNGLRVHLTKQLVIVFKPGEQRQLSWRERFLEWLASVLIRDPQLTSVASMLGGGGPVVTCVGAVQLVRCPDDSHGLVFITSQGEADEATQGAIVDLFYKTFIKRPTDEQQQTTVN